MKANINIETLKAISLAASSEETRYYLKGVYVEVTENTVTYTATNGHILLSRREDAKEANTLTGAWIIPLDFIKAAKPSKHCPTADMALMTGANGGTMLAFTGGYTGMAAPIDGTFPNYRRIIPASASGEVAQFDGVYTGTLAKFAKALGLGFVNIHHNGENAAPIAFNTRQGVFGVLMPLRQHHSTATPVWNAETAALSPDELKARAQAAHAAELAREAA
jgi:DNA polymerase-3 subunit beta